MAKPRKSAPSDLPAQQDPDAPLDAAAFLRAAQPTLRRLTDDLLVRADASPRVTAALKRQHATARAQHRTAEEFVVWRRSVVVQVAAAWLLSCVFIRVLEDRNLIHARLAGPSARDSEAIFFQFAPSLTHREYLLTVFRELTRLPAAADLFDARHNLVWRLAPSETACKDLLKLFRTPSIEAPAFRFGQLDTRFLGDLYQDIDEDVREHYALLQTPDFVESFILDHTLEPAIREYGIDHANLIDPTCGSGHFLLGAFPRFLDHLKRAHPAADDRDLATRALDKIFGVDINPYAASIARFRLFLKFVEVGQYKVLRDTPKPPIHVVPADSLLYGFAGGQGDLSERDAEHGSDAFGEGFNLEDAAGAREILVKRTYTAVVGNPPYITVKDSALREKYRQRYTAAAGKYALSAPFMQRFFALGKSEGGYIGQITASSFTKRDFGKPLIEKVLRELELNYIVNTSGVFLPGHDTPTILVFGRNRKIDLTTSQSKVLAILAKHGEPGVPSVPAESLVWRSILEHSREVGFENEYISIEEIERSGFNKHPWTLEGGGASALKEHLERSASTNLAKSSDSIGICAFTLEDEVFIRSDSTWGRSGLPSRSFRRMIIGEDLRDWSRGERDLAIFPYASDFAALPIQEHPGIAKALWPWQTTLSNNILFAGKTKVEGGLHWYEFGRLSYRKLKTPLSITFAFVATHNHFVLDRGGSVFNRSAPIIKLSEVATEDDHLALLAYLNSSLACFWMKQVFFPKSTSNKDLTTERGKPEEKYYEFAANLLGSLPLPTIGDLGRLIPFARSLEALQHERTSHSPNQTIANALTKNANLAQSVHTAETRDRALLHRMIADQEDLDWAVYAIFGLVPPELATKAPVGIGLAPDERPFNASTSPGHLVTASADVFELWQARAQRIHNPGSKQLRLIENPVNKRRWWGARGVFAHKVATFHERCVTAAEEKIGDLAEEWLRTATTATTRRALAQTLHRDARYQALEEFVTGLESQRDPLTQQLERESVPFLAGHRYSAAGREKQSLWQYTWSLQREATILDSVTAQTPSDRVKAFAFRATIATPPKYEPGDFRDGNFYRLRGKLDVPKERFISYPGCASDVDLEPVYGWAGWDHLQRALALFQLYYARKDEAWTPERLVPMLAGLDELLPWVRQWHADACSPETGQLYHEYFDQVIASEAAELGVSRASLATWAPPERGAGRKPAKARSTEPTDAADDDEPAPTPKRRGKAKPKAPATPDSPAAPARKRKLKAVDETPPASE